MIFDEADTLLDQGYDDQMAYFMRIVVNDEIIQQRGSPARAIFVSATLGGSLRTFLKTTFGDSNTNYFETVLDSKTHLNLSNIRHDFLHLDDFDKHNQFQTVLKELSFTLKKQKTQAIVFCDTIKSAQSTEHFISEQGYQSVSLHGDVPAKLRL